MYSTTLLPSVFVKMNTVECGKKGELFVMRRMFDDGWIPCYDLDSFEEVDFAFEKESTIIKIQIKASPNNGIFKLSGKQDKLDYIEKNWDFVAFTNFKDIWFLPYELLKRSCGDFIRVIKSYECFKNNYNVLSYSEFKLWEHMIDNRVRWY